MTGGHRVCDNYPIAFRKRIPVIIIGLRTPMVGRADNSADEFDSSSRCIRVQLFDGVIFRLIQNIYVFIYFARDKA